MQQRSPLIVVLLFAATIAVDAVSAYWTLTAELSQASIDFYFGLMFSQLGLLSAWAVLAHRKIGLRWLVPFAAALIAAIVPLVVIERILWQTALMEGTGPVEGELRRAYFAFVGMFWLDAASALSALWLLKPTRLVRKSGETNEAPAWQFSIKNVLILMTGLSILLVVLVESGAMADSPASTVTLIVSNVLLLIAVVGVCSTTWHWFVRFGTALSAATMIGVGFTVASADLSQKINLTAYYYVQAIVLFTWLELGPILPAASANANVDSPTKTRPTP
jgi:hypothetical protein